MKVICTDPPRSTGAKIRVDNLHYDLSEDELRVCPPFLPLHLAPAFFLQLYLNWCPDPNLHPQS